MAKINQSTIIIAEIFLLEFSSEDADKKITPWYLLVKDFHDNNNIITFHSAIYIFK